MGKTRREWLKDTLRVGAVFATAPLSSVPADPTTEGSLALNRAAYASSSSDFINTGHMATDWRGHNTMVEQRCRSTMDLR